MDSLRAGGPAGKGSSSSSTSITGGSGGGSRSYLNSHTSTQAPSPAPPSQYNRDSSNIPERVLSPASSDAGSVTSSTVQGDTSRRESLNGTSSSRRLGNLQGAGLSSLSLALGTDAGFTAGSSLVGFNAISTILNNPNKPQRPIDPSSSRYPPISQSHTELPKVKRSDYDATLQSIRSEWDRYQRNQKLGVRGKARLEADDESERDGRAADNVEDEARTLARRSQVVDDDEDTPARALGKKRLPPLSTVPQVFFSEDFDLGNPYTFDLVTERYKAASSPAASASVLSSSARNGILIAGYDVALNQMLQEKLSYYSDVVEQHLILEISARSSSFFAALGNLKDLEAESRNCLDKVEELKRELDDRDEGIAKAGLRLVREQAKQREVKERLEAVGLMHQLCEKRDLCQLLVQNNEWSEALDVMQDLADLISGKAKLVPRENPHNALLPPHVDLDLSSVAAVQSLSPQLHDIRNNIAAQLEVEVLSILMADIEERIKQPRQILSSIDSATPVVAQPSESTTDIYEANPPSTASKLNTRNAIALQEDEQRLADRLAAHVKGLIRTEGMDRAATAYKEAMIKIPRKNLRAFLHHASTESARTADGDAWLGDLASLLEDDEAAQGKADAKLGPGGAEAASKLQALEFEQFIELLQTLLKGLTSCVQAVDAQRRVLVKLLDDEGRRQNGETGDSEGKTLGLLMPIGVSPSLPASLAGVVSDVCSASHVLASRTLSLRSATHTVLSLTQFLAVFRLAWSFILESEALCGRMIIGLRGVVLNQAKTWLSYFHKTRIEKAAKAVEEEQWGQADVTAKQQSDIGIVIESATSDPPTLVVQDDTSKAGEEIDTSSKNKTLAIEDKQYFIVGASLDVLDMLVDYLRVVISLPLLGTEIMGRIVEFLKQFNSRTCQVVLGAGAMRSAGLKNITAKHLALASQSLSIMITLIPYVRESVRRHLNPRQAVMLVEFDKLKRDYQEHQYEIHSKLVAIMSDRLTVHCRALASTDWSVPLTEASSDAQSSAAVLVPKPMLDLVKETTTLHKVLCKYLQPSVVELVIGQVLLSVDTRIASELRKVEAHDETMRKRAKAVRDHFEDKFGTLKHVDWTAKELDAALEEINRAPPTPKVSVDEARPLSPTAPSPAPSTPTMYKPRLNLFARKQQQQKATVAAAAATKTERESVDSLANTRTSVDADSVRASTSRAASPVRASIEAQLIAESEAPPPTRQSVEEQTAERATEPLPLETSAQAIDEADAADVSTATQGDLTLPPPTPIKDSTAREKTEVEPTVATSPSTDEVPLPSATLTDDKEEENSTPPVALDTSDVAPSTPVKDKSVTSETVQTGAQSPPAAPASLVSPASRRMTLQQRLAEAARRRAQSTSTSRTGSEADGGATPAKTAHEQVVTSIEAQLSAESKDVQVNDDVVAESSSSSTAAENTSMATTNNGVSNGGGDDDARQAAAMSTTQSDASPEHVVQEAETATDTQPDVPSPATTPIEEPTPTDASAADDMSVNNGEGISPSKLATQDKASSGSTTVVSGNDELGDVEGEAEDDGEGDGGEDGVELADVVEPGAEATKTSAEGAKTAKKGKKKKKKGKK